jgi:hypothetical protein
MKRERGPLADGNGFDVQQFYHQVIQPECDFTRTLRGNSYSQYRPEHNLTSCSSPLPVHVPASVILIRIIESNRLPF